MIISEKFAFLNFMFYVESLCRSALPLMARASCCADILCSFSPVLLLIKDRKLPLLIFALALFIKFLASSIVLLICLSRYLFDGIFQSLVMFVQLVIKNHNIIFRD